MAGAPQTRQAGLSGDEYEILRESMRNPRPYTPSRSGSEVSGRALRGFIDAMTIGPDDIPLNPFQRYSGAYDAGALERLENDRTHPLRTGTTEWAMDRGLSPRAARDVALISGHAPYWGALHDLQDVRAYANAGQYGAAGASGLAAAISLAPFFGAPVRSSVKAALPAVKAGAKKADAALGAAAKDAAAASAKPDAADVASLASWEVSDAESAAQSDMTPEERLYYDMLQTQRMMGVAP